ncbi:MAG: tetratricopeptide repeat protein [Chloroflexi bacterium]|nr:tetratricopeptide repeat protein [Chloroflexota bacterium]
MREIDWMRQIQRKYSASQVSFLVAALRQEDLIWKAIFEQNLYDRLLAASDGDITQWLPASIVIEQLGEPISVMDLKSNPMLPIETRLQKQAVGQYEAILRESRLPSSLAEAGLVALALRERRRVKNNWTGLVQELIGWEAGNQSERIRQWKGVLVCLYGMVPDPAEMLISLYSACPAPHAVDLVLHILLANCLDQETLINRLTAFLVEIGENFPTQWLRRLTAMGRQELARELAGTLLMLRARRADAPSLRADLSQPASQILDLHEKSGLLAAAGSIEEAGLLQKKLQKDLESWQRDMLLEEIANRRTTLTQNEIRNFVEVFQAEPAQMAEFLMQLAELPEDIVTAEVLESMPAALQLKNALSVMKRDRSDAHEANARKSLDDLRREMGISGKAYASRLDLDWHPDEVLTDLLALQLYREAATFGEMLLIERRSDARVCSGLSAAYQELGNQFDATCYGYLASLLKPDRWEYLRSLGKILERYEDWDGAYEARARLVETGQDVGLGDWICLAECGLKTHRFEKAIEAGGQALLIDGQNGAAHYVMGLAKLSAGEVEDGIEHLTTATLVKPENPDAWLSLADAYSQSGQTQRALETLRSAALSVPESAEVNYQLAVLYRQNQEYSEALPFLKKAASLSPHSAEVASQLSQTLLNLGYLDEAEGFLEQARNQWPGNHDIAYTQANVFIAQNRKNDALPPLEVAVKARNAPKEWFMLYAETLIGDAQLVFAREGKVDYTRLVNAKQALEKVLAFDPDHRDAQVLYAEVLLAKGEYEPALGIYQSLMEGMDSSISSKDWRIRAGFGKAALQLGKVDAALASLQSAANNQPNQAGILQLLAEAYRAAVLPKEAMQEANRVLKMNPNDPETLIWFARMALMLGDHESAIQTLKCLTELRPEKSHFWIELAGLQVEVGRVEEAKRTLNLMLSHETVNLDGFKRAASLFLQIQDYKQAAFCLERAVLLNHSEDADLLFILGCLEYLAGDDKAALGHIQVGTELQPESAPFFVLECDILNRLERHQAAEACLEQAAKLLETQTAVTVPADAMINHLPEDFIRSITLPEYIYLRKAEACFAAGDPICGEGYLQQCLSLNPAWLAARLMLVEMRRGHLEVDKAVQLIDEMVDELSFEQSAESERRWWVELLCAKVEIELEKGQYQDAARALQPALAFGPEFPRVMAAQSRILISRGEWKAAEGLYLSAVRGMEQSSAESIDFEWFYKHTPILCRQLDTAHLWMSQAAVDNRQWSQAIAWCEEYLDALPAHMGGQLMLVSHILRLLEDRDLYQDLGSDHHAPVTTMPDAACSASFDRAASLLVQSEKYPQIEFLKALGEAAFKPSAETISLAVSKLENQEQASLLLALLRRQGNQAGALQIAVKLPQTYRSAIQQALCFLEENQEAGLKHLENRLLAEPENPLLVAAKAELHVAAGQPSMALSAFQSALAIWPDEPKWQAGAARMAEKMDDIELALRHWQSAVRCQPDDAGYRLALAAVYLRRQLPSKALEVLEPLQEKNAGQAQLWALYARAFLQMRYLDKSLICAQKAIQLEPASGDYCLLAAQIARESENMKLALNYGAQAFSLEKNSLAITQFLSQIHTENGDYEKALKVIEQSSPAVQQTTPALHARAWLIRNIHGAAVALPLLDEIIEREPRNVEVIAMKAEFLLETGDLKNAEKTAIEALKMDPRQSRLNLLVGRMKHNAGQLDQAVQYLSEAIRQNSEEIEAYLELGKTYQERRENGKAIQIYQQAIRVSPNDFRSYFNAGLILRESKDYVEAETMLRKAAELSPDNVNIRRQLGAIVALNLVHNS